MITPSNMPTIENHSFKITIATAVSLVVYIVYTAMNYGGWSQRIENRIETIEKENTQSTAEEQRNKDSIRELERKIAGQDVALAEIKKDVSQILFEIRKK